MSRRPMMAKPDIASSDNLYWDSLARHAGRSHQHRQQLFYEKLTSVPSIKEYIDHSQTV